jgi:hypothetical protein
MLGLYYPMSHAWRGELSFFARFRPIALGTLAYIALGYLLGFLLPVSSTPQSSEATGDRHIKWPLALVLAMVAAITLAGGC